MLEDQMMAEGYDEIAIVDEHDNVIGHAPILSRHDADKMSNEDADNYIHKLADAAGLREEFEQMKEDMQVLMSFIAFHVNVVFDADAEFALYNSHLFESRRAALLHVSLLWLKRSKHLCGHTKPKLFQC
jgi:hypothetical protein